jgi:hypothetical protein
MSVPKQYVLYLDDGIWDIGLGLLLVSIAVLSVVDMPWMASIWLYPLGLLTVGAKRLITGPRLADVDLDSGKVAKPGMALAAMLAVAVMVLLFGAFFAVESGGRLWWTSIALRRAIVTTLLALIPGGSLAGLAYLLGCGRLYVHALLTAAAISGATVLQSTTPLLLGGTAIMLIGVAYLIAFLRRHPRLTERKPGSFLS